MVIRQSLKTRFLAAFVVLFICLNAGAAVCVAYCQSTDDGLVVSEHCPLKKAERHCGTTAARDNNSSASINSDQIDCCPMTLSFFAVPVEKSSFRFDTAAMGLTAKVPARGVIEFTGGTLTPAINYRGPPFLDRRTDRLKQRLLRI